MGIDPVHFLSYTLTAPNSFKVVEGASMADNQLSYVGEFDILPHDMKDEATHDDQM